MFSLFGRSSTSTGGDAARQRRLERKLDLILAHLGIPYEDADRGEKIAAIKEYRTASGAGLAEAKRAVEDYLARRSQ